MWSSMLVCQACGWNAISTAPYRSFYIIVCVQDADMDAFDRADSDSQDEGAGRAKKVKKVSSQTTTFFANCCLQGKHLVTFM